MFYKGSRCVRESMPNFFMREISVVRLIPMRAAAPSGPPTRPLVTLRRRTISSRSSASYLTDTGVFLPLLPSSAIGACRAVPCVRITERSMKFSSSRIFPVRRQLFVPINDNYFSPYCLRNIQQPSGLWEKWESSAFCWISKLGGKVRVLDFSTERLFPQPFGRRIFL